MNLFTLFYIIFGNETFYIHEWLELWILLASTISDDIYFKKWLFYYQSPGVYSSLRESSSERLNSYHFRRLNQRISRNIWNKVDPNCCHCSNSEKRRNNSSSELERSSQPSSTRFVAMPPEILFQLPPQSLQHQLHTSRSVR